jgi:hypothetical protein
VGNPISDELTIGTIAELLVQLRLLQYGVQAAPPIKDSGNDLIAIKGDCVKFIQVKATKHNVIRGLNRLQNKIYHILAVVKLEILDKEILLDNSKIFLIPKDEIGVNSLRVDKIANKYELSRMVSNVWI